MVSFPLEAENLTPGTYLLQLFAGSEMVYKEEDQRWLNGSRQS